MSTLTTANLTGVSSISSASLSVTNSISVGSGITINTTAIYLNGVPSGPTGNGTDSVFFVNGLTVNTSYSIPTGKSAHAVGPLTVASGVTITVPTGSKFVVL